MPSQLSKSSTSVRESGRTSFASRTSTSAHTSRARHALVLGAGFGGIAAALRLRARGFRVTLIDGLPELGGRARVFSRNGYTFDAGPTIITAPQLFEELFALFDENFHDHVDLRPVWPWYRVQWEDGATFDYGGDPDLMCEQIARFDASDQDGYRRMLRHAERIYAIGFEQLGDAPFDRASTMLRTAHHLVRVGARRSMYSFVSKYIKHERLRQVFSFQPLLVGGNPYTTSCIYSLIQPLEQKFGVHYAMGGTGAIVRALGALMERHGVDVRLGSMVRRITANGQRVTGVELEDGTELFGDLLVSNADPVTLYDRLLPKAGPHQRTRRRSQRMKLSMGLFVLYFGSRRTYTDLAHHTILLSDRYKDLLDDIYTRGVLPPDPSLYVHAPTRTDPSMAPDGHECFYALAPVPNLRLFNDWRDTSSAYADLILERIEQHLAPDLRASLDSVFQVTPEYFRDELQSAGGAGFNVQPILSQSAYFRFHNRCPHYRNLFLVGAGTHPGAGIPGTLCTAKTMENVLIRDGVVA